jgi:undecaprenyl-diphosphatase
MMDFAAAAQAVDTTLLLLINRTLANPLFDLLMPLLSNKWVGLSLAGCALPLLLARGGRRAWVLLAAGLLAVGLADLGANTIKHLIQRLRPCHDVALLQVLAGCTRSFSMPSNHAANIAAVAATIWLGWRSWPWTGLAWLLAAGVMVSRVYLGVHYPSDVLVGALWGTGMGAALVIVARRCFPNLLADPSRSLSPGRPESAAPSHQKTEKNPEVT